MEMTGTGGGTRENERWWLSAIPTGSLVISGFSDNMQSRKSYPACSQEVWLSLPRKPCELFLFESAGKGQPAYQVIIRHILDPNSISNASTASRTLVQSYLSRRTGLRIPLYAMSVPTDNNKFQPRRSRLT